MNSSIKPSNPFEVLKTDGPRDINISDLLAPKTEEVKRKRGRPSLAEVKSRETNQKPTTGQDNAALPSAPIGSLNQPVIAPSALKPLLKAPFTFASQRTEIPEIALTEKEADDLVPALEVILRQYSAQMNSPHAALYAFLLSLGIISTQKYFIYKDVQNERDRIRKENETNQPKASQ